MSLYYSHIYLQISYSLEGMEETAEAELTRELVPIPCNRRCQNPETNDTYHLKDKCSPETFAEHCPDCPDVSRVAI